MESAFFNGDNISCEDVDAALRDRGLTQDRIELIRMRAYQTVCCEDMNGCNSVYPVIDYGSPRVLFYEALMPALNEYNKAYPKRYVWDYCPFCGKSTRRIIHPDSQTSIDGTF